MSKEFDFIDLYYLNDITDTKKETTDFSLFDEVPINKASNLIEISGTSDEDSVSYTYDKFLEILDTQGLEGLVRA
jgi:hypothetical protein